MKKCLILLIALALTFTSASAFAAVTDPLANEPGVSPIVKEPGSVTLNLAMVQNVNVSSYDDNYLTQWVEDKTGVNLEFTLFPSTDSNSKLDMLVASGAKLPDLITFGVSDRTRAYNYAVNGAIIPLTDYYHSDMGQFFFNRCESIGLDPEAILKEAALVDGNVYGSIYRDDNFANYYSLRAFINQTWLDKLGLKAPTTYQELYDVLVAFRDQDPNGNGQKDEIPMIGQELNSWQAEPLAYLQNMFIYFNDNETYVLPLSETNGKLDVAYDKDAYREFLKYANKLVSEGLLDETSFTQDGTTYSALKRSAPAVIGIAVTGGAVDLYFGNSPDTYVPFEVCSGPDGVQWQTASRSDAGIRTAISADCEHPEIAFMLTQYVYNNEDTMEWFYIHRWGEQNVDWRFAQEGEEGMFSAFGYKPNLLQLQNTWGVMTNKHWQGTELMNNVCYAPEIMEVFAGSASNDEYQYAQNYGLNKDHAPAFSDLLPALNYTQEETDQWTDARTALKTFIRESRVQFAMGQKDPASDADWDQYINELNVLKYKDILAVDQAAYERMFGAQ